MNLQRRKHNVIVRALGQVIRAKGDYLEKLGQAMLYIVSVVACTESRQWQPASDVEWVHYAGALDGNKYSPLADIDSTNVARLELAWQVRVEDFPTHVYDPDGHRAGSHDEQGRPVAPRVGAACGSCHRRQTRFEATPLMSAGVLYVSTPLSRVVALNAVTGKRLWTFDPRIDLNREFAEDLVSRGVALWRDAMAMPSSPCSIRVFLATVEAVLYAIDARTGMICRDFGSMGVVQLSALSSAKEHGADEYSVTSPPTILGDLVIVGSAVAKTTGVRSPPGIVAALHARTGALVWSFRVTSQRGQDHLGRAVRDSSHEDFGGANVWSVMSADSSRDMLFVPTSGPESPFYGGGRRGDNEHANSVLALRASTGKLLWSFQVVHHDVWDYDVASQPALVTLFRAGRAIPAVVIATKMGFLYILDRVTGRPIFPLEERRVPPTDVPGELTSNTQPFPIEPHNLHGGPLALDSAFGLSARDRSFCRQWMRELRNDGLFTPPSLNGSLIWPGFWGGMNWGGVAWHQDNQLLIAPVKRIGMVVRLWPENAETESRLGTLLLRSDKRTGTYRATREAFVAQSGIPCSPPPWNILAALDLTGNTTLWRKPVGTIPSLAGVSGSEKWGSLSFGGPLVTKGGLVFIGASQDNLFRALNLNTGKEIWKYRLPAGGQASPMTYRFAGRQYVVITAGGRAGIGDPGDWIVAFRLKDADANHRTSK